jgi:hypothetical protein
MNSQQKGYLFRSKAELGRWATIEALSEPCAITPRWESGARWAPATGKPMGQRLYSTRFCEPQSERINPLGQTWGEYFPADKSRFNPNWLDEIETSCAILDFGAIQSGFLCNKRQLESESEEALEQEFNERAERWEKESGIYSSPGAAILHRDYQRIIGMGKPAIPLILERLQTSGADWFWALRHISGEEEDPAKNAQNIEEATLTWIKWGREKGYIA